MKKILYIVVLAAIGLFASCSDFLNEQLKGSYTSSNLYTTPANATEAVTGIYNSLYGNTLWIFGDVASDDAVKGGNAGDQPAMVGIDDFSATSDNGALATFWQSTYETISRANNAIYYIAPMNIDVTLRNRLVGEAKYLRALSYFNLVNIFGKVPLKLLPQLTSATINVPLSDVVTIYAQIEKDLTDAVAVLPTSYTTEKGRATQGAALGMLAKVDLYQNKYADCLTNIQALDNLHQYNLLSNYANLFKAGSEDSTEVIFATRFIQSTVSPGDILTVEFAPLIEGGYAFDAPTQSFVDAFTDSTIYKTVDPRLDASIGRDGMPWFDNTTFSSSWSEATGYLVKKYDENTIPGIPKDQSAIPSIYMRYADILLMKAEALNEIGGASGVSNAAIEVNKVRSRVNLAPTTATTQDAMRTVIMNERRKELGFEFHRFFDLMRWGQTIAESALPGIKWTAPRFYYPIPQIELDTNKALQ